MNFTRSPCRKESRIEENLYSIGKSVEKDTNSWLIQVLWLMIRVDVDHPDVGSVTDVEDGDHRRGDEVDHRDQDTSCGWWGAFSQSWVATFHMHSH